ncbi:hypothetical protein [Aquabacterium sp. OR-4]|uniref:hypothetical protein n=1 Tax=Aquabacterium sp. OR-4 TaxID=2978127 RepID=UPI0021B1B7C0|nr:hypothetical protein [Aquabacterium sp. OR-4]MDT7838235.1 hypothetical protein [Aquabacterium sp. OR-4]
MTPHLPPARPTGGAHRPDGHSARAPGHAPAPRRPWRVPATLGLAVLASLAGCASAPPATRIENAATTPLVDLNLLQQVIPEVLQAARKAPYGPPDAGGCAALQAEINALDEALGPDLDAPASDTRPGLIERGSSLAGDAAVGALQRTAEGLVPFRGWVRKLSGAEQRSRAVAAAIAAGGVRRAFLKGLRQAQACPQPVPSAAPAVQHTPQPNPRLLDAVRP